MAFNNSLTCPGLALPLEAFIAWPTKKPNILPRLASSLARYCSTCSALAAAHKRYRVECSAYITACNPFSQILDDAANAERHAALGREISQRSLASIEGIGQHPSNQWPGEASHLIFGLTLEAAKALGTRLEQNAIVWAGGDAVPQLILLR